MSQPATIASPDVGRQQRGEHAERRRLAGAVRAEEGDELALLHGEVDGADGLDGLPLGAERLREATCGDHLVRHTASLPRHPVTSCPALRRYLGHGRDHLENARTPLPAAEPPALVGARARRSARRQRAHAAPRRRAPARARLRHRVDARQRRRLPARGGHRACRRCCSPTTRASPSRSACARRRPPACAAPSTPRSAPSRRSSRCCRRRCDAASTRSPRTRRSASARPRRARSPGARGRHRAARPARARLSRLRATAVHATRMPRARRRRASIEPYRLVPVARRWYLLAWDRQREDWRTFRLDRISDVFQTRVHFEPRPMTDEEARARVERALRWRDRSVRARVVVDLPQAELVEHLGWYGRDVVADGAVALRLAARGRHGREPRDGAHVGAAWRDLPGRGSARGARVPRRRRRSGSAQRLPAADPRPVRVGLIPCARAGPLRMSGDAAFASRMDIAFVAGFGPIGTRRCLVGRVLGRGVRHPVQRGRTGTSTPSSCPASTRSRSGR